MFSKKYEILEHPADLKIRSYGKKMDEIFSNMIEGMFKSCRPEMTKEKVSREIKIEYLDRESLLVNFLSEALTLSDINEEVYLKVKFDKLTDKYLKAKLEGYKIKSRELEIKAVTWHNLKIEKKGDHLEAIVLFDI